ncbi:MAG: CBS domain-containing protein [Firmicutes bacterium]|nr:CBS domain-containing protein [Bacillota bacterium]
MKIKQLLADKGNAVMTVKSTDSVLDAAKLMAEHKIGALVVSEDKSHIDGLISERDIVRRLSQIAGPVVSEPVSSIMTSSVYVCQLEDEVDYVMEVMTDNKVRHLPVVCDGKMCGMISIGDIVKSRIQELKSDAEHLLKYISAR